MPQLVSNFSPARPDSECVDVVGHTGSLGTTQLSLWSQISKHSDVSVKPDLLSETARVV